MTETLMQLLHDEATHLAVPPPATDAVVRRGRSLRRRRRVVTGVAVLATAVVVGSGGAYVTAQVRAGDEAVTFSTDKYRTEGALAVDSELYVAGKHIPFEESVKSFLYTSVGTVVRSGTSPWTDDADVDHYTLVRPDGSREQVDLSTNDRVVATEPDSTHLAFAEPDGDRWDLVVMDLETGEELGRATVDGTFTWGGWEAPPVALDGDVVWAHFDNGWTELDWRTGETREVPGTGSVYEIANGHYAVRGDGVWEIRAMADGRLLQSLDLPRRMYGMFSPDGRFMKFFDQEDGLRGHSIEPFVVDVRSGVRTPLPDPAWDFGWTPDGDLLALSDGKVSTCPADTALCTPTGLRVEQDQDSTVKLGGNSYES